MTPGQEEIRQIVQHHLNICDKDQCDKDCAERVRGEFAVNPIIVNDKITGAALGFSHISENYIDWLKRDGPAERLRGGYPAVNTNSLVYTHMNLEGHPPAYSGGIKWESTMACLFGLCRGDILNSSAWELNWFPDSDLLTIGAGGNHRGLAHMLWSNSDVTPSRMNVYRSNHDDDLNQALLALNRIVAPNKLQFEACEANTAKTFVRETTASEQVSLRKPFSMYQLSTEGFSSLHGLTFLRSYLREGFLGRLMIKKHSDRATRKILSKIHHARIFGRSTTRPLE